MEEMRNDCLQDDRAQSSPGSITRDRSADSDSAGARTSGSIRSQCVVCAGRLEALGISEPMAVRAGKAVLPADEYRLSECVACGLVQTTFDVQQSQLDDLYSNEDDKVVIEATGQDPDEVTAERIPEFEAAVEFIVRSQNERGGTLLDVGCQDGRFLEIAREAGFDVYGAELGRFHSERARERIGAERVVTASVEQLSADRLFDVVTLLETLEHLADPKAGLERLLALGRPDGAIIVSVPSWHYFQLKGRMLALIGRLTGRRLRGQVHTHVTVYTMRALRSLGAACGLVVTHERPTGWHGRLQWMNRVCRTAHKLGIPLLSELGPSLIVRFVRASTERTT